MTPEKGIVLAAVTFGSIYLCANTLELINKRVFDYSLPSMCNYLIFGLSSGMMFSVTKNVLKNI